jgi:hypothetical protein
MYLNKYTELEHYNPTSVQVKRIHQTIKQIRKNRLQYGDVPSASFQRSKLKIGNWKKLIRHGVGVLVLLTVIASAVRSPCMQLQLAPSRHRSGVPVCGAPVSRRPALGESASPHENSASASMSENRKCWRRRKRKRLLLVRSAAKGLCQIGNYIYYILITYMLLAPQPSHRLPSP